MWGLPGMYMPGVGAGCMPANPLAAAAGMTAAQGGAFNEHQQLQEQLLRQLMAASAGCLGQNTMNVAQSSLPAEAPNRKRNLQEDEADPAAFFEKRQRLDSPPTEEDLMAFRLRYPMDERAYVYLSTAPAAAQQKVLSEFKPRVEGEADYSSLITTLVKRARLAVGNAPGLANSWVASSPSATANFDRGDEPPTEDELINFRLRYPMDDRAFDYLQSAPVSAQIRVLSDFKPKTEGEEDYSSLVTAFTKRFRLAAGRNAAPPAVSPASAPLAAALFNRQQKEVEAPSQEELLLFRLRYPMDERAFEYLASAPAAAQRKVVSEFQPKVEGEGDYSSLVTTRVKRARQAALGTPLQSLPFLMSSSPAATSQGAGGQWAELRDALRQAVAGPAPKTASPQQWQDLRDALRQVCGGPGKGGKGGKGGKVGKGHMDLSGLDQIGGPLQEFRDLYPMDDRAFDFLRQAGAAVQAVVFAEYRPKREGDSDHSAPVTSYVKVVRNRLRHMPSA
eukprot:TRINITY_DN26593_c0_g1_i1.p1 TRINITY_DN26593_c0_g1~~TRINITY_DN26593_c0_g1_i1.p1  ORF type:complete len:505 (-),score=78.57 TRINITY_DN26593_c0_g1_i1:240-1754(-)